MEVAMIAAVLGAIVLLVWLSKKLNAYSEEEFGYTPIGFGTIFLGMIPYVLIVAGIIFAKSGSENLPIAVGLAILSTGGLYAWIASRSSQAVALGATVLLLLIGLPALLLLFGASGRNDDYYYYD